LLLQFIDCFHDPYAED
jgi:type IV secretory pathway VirB10-like protein